MKRFAGWMVVPLLAVGLWTSTPAWAIQAGITLDVHQDIEDPLFWPNDFHIEGLICSNDGSWPVVLQHLDDLFPYFDFQIQYLGDCWYWFEATWWMNPGEYIPYCTVIHLGLLFDVNAANVVIDLVGWWTRDGQPVGNIYGNLMNQGYVPLMGFNVADTGSPQIITIGNGDIPITPPLPTPLPPLPPWPPHGLDLMVMKADVIPFPPGVAPNFNELYEFGQQQFWPWVPVTFGDGTPVNPGRPLFIMPDSFFDVFLSVPPPGTGDLGVQTPFTIEPGGFLVARQLVQFVNNSGYVEQRWFWEIHGAQETEACCFADGSCQDLLPFTCRQLGGTPMGPGTNCFIVDCPVLGACCYGQTAIQCVVTDQLTCEQTYLGQWKGAGTNCDDLNGNLIADICEEQELGACCYGEVAILCIITDQLTCEQVYLGEWKGLGTNCDDLNGNLIADICEEPQPKPEACCLLDGTCVMTPPANCLAMGGEPKGLGSHCLGDLNGNDIDDICEVKWLQPPDLDVTGIDVNASEPFILADDFLCTQRSLITEIIVWGSWRNDELPGDPMNVEFRLSLHKDIPDPDEQGPAYSMPGQPLWFHIFPPGTYVAQPYATGLQEGWMDPPAGYFFPGDTVCWMYRFNIPASEAFCQEGSPDQPLVYWLDVQARPLAGPALAQFGWKTSTRHWNDDAVWGQGIEPYPGPWNELRYPPQHPYEGQSIDLAFAVGGNEPCEPVGACCTAGVCTVVTQAACLAGGGYYKGDGTFCTAATCVCKGDANCDGLVNFADINPFVTAIVSGVYCDGTGANCDMDGNGSVGFEDINPFVNLLTNNPLPIICP